MSGRMYDPVLGRMVSPDNFVAIPGSNAITPTVSGYLGSIASPVLRNTLIQATTGATVGFAIGTGSSLLTGSSFGEALAAGGKNAAFGFTTGAVFGGVTGYKDAVKNHHNPWTGKYEFDVSPVETARATTPDISAGLENKPEEIEYQTVRHHRDPNSLKAIEKSMQINPSRGVPLGVDVEVQPFTELKSVNVVSMDKELILNSRFQKAHYRLLQVIWVIQGMLAEFIQIHHCH